MGFLREGVARRAHQAHLAGTDQVPDSAGQGCGLAAADGGDGGEHPCMTLTVFDEAPLLRREVQCCHSRGVFPHAAAASPGLEFSRFWKMTLSRHRRQIT